MYTYIQLYSPMIEYILVILIINYSLLDNYHIMSIITSHISIVFTDFEGTPSKSVIVFDTTDHRII